MQGEEEEEEEEEEDDDDDDDDDEEEEEDGGNGDDDEESGVSSSWMRRISCSDREPSLPYGFVTSSNATSTCSPPSCFEFISSL